METKEQLPINRQKVLDCVFIFLICLLPRLYQTLQIYPLNFISDETSSLSIAATVAGYDWNDVVSQAGYYGIGFLWIFAPLFKIGLSPVVIYRIIASVLAGVNALTGPLFYMIMSRFFHVESRFKKVVVASICGNLILFYVATIATRNEEILALLVCVSVYLICKIIEERKFRDEILLSLVMLYALVCHTRAVAIILAVMLVSILYAIFYRKKLFHYKTYIINIIGYGLIAGLLNLYRTSIWGNGTVRNSSVTSGVGSALSNIFATDSILRVLKCWGRIVVGQIFTASTITGGLFLIATVVCLIYLFYFFKKRKGNFSEILFVLSLLALILVYGTIFTQGLTWLPGVYNGIYVEHSYTYVYAYKSFTYMRYFGPFVPLLIMTASCCWEKNDLFAKKYTLLKRSTIFAVPCYIGLLALFINFILPYLDPYKPEYLYFLAGFTHDNGPELANWYRAFAIAGAIFLLYLIVVLMDRVEIALAISLILLICEQVYVFNNFTIITDNNKYGKADAGYALIQNSGDTFGNDIYVYDTSDADDHQIWYMYQYLNYSCHVIPELPENTEEDFILFTNGEVNFDRENIVGYKLDNNEYVYTNVPEYERKIETLLTRGVG